MRTPKLIGALGAVTVAIGGLLLVAGGPAYGDTPPAPTSHAGNATTCDDAGLSGDILVGSGGQPQNASNAAGSGTISGDGKSLTVVINDGFTASGIVVKGADSYNVYTGPFVGPITLTPLVAPLSNGGQVPGVSHWYVCGTTTTTTTTTTSSSSSSSSSSSPGTPPGSTPPGGNLPLTGVAVGGFVAAGVALIAGGIALLFFRRRRDVTDAS